MLITKIEITKLISSTNKSSSGKKGHEYLIGCKDDEYKINVLYIMPPKWVDM